jgi:hypothetical protein
MAAERQSVRGALKVLGPSLMEVSHGNKKEFDALEYVVGGDLEFTGSGYESRRRQREGYFQIEDELAALAKSRPNPKRNRRR